MKIHRVVSLVILVGFGLTTMGCATILSGTHQAITVTSEPPGANVQIGPYQAVTPATMDIPKGKQYPVEVTLNSDRKVMSLARVFDPVGLLNIIPPLWPGFIVDLITGSFTKYDPETINVNFNNEAFAFQSVTTKKHHPNR